MQDIRYIFEEFRKKVNSIQISVEQMKEDMGSSINKIVLYGAGSAGIAFLKYLRDVGIEPRYFADANSERWGNCCEDILIIPPGEIASKVGEDALVIVTINTDGKRYCKSFDEALRRGGHPAVHKMLQEYGCCKDIDYTYFRRVHDLFHGDPYNLPSCSDVLMMQNNEEKIIEAFSMLSDEMSKEIFYKILKFRMLDDSIVVPTISQEKQYFEYDVFERRNDEVFIDCGAFNGISAQTFFKENDNCFKRYYGFEPDKTNYKALCSYFKTLPRELQSKSELLNKAVYDQNGEMRLYSLNGPGSFMADIGNDTVTTIKLDTVLSGETATYIKMNIEGAEIAALKGARKTLELFRPKLAIAGYHKTWDMWMIPLLIKESNPEYKIYLRSYMNHLSFIYYCK